MAKWQFRLGEAGNTYGPALQTLVDRGYRIQTRSDESGQTNEWIATKDGRLFSGCNPLSLLGLVAIWEQHGENWQKADPDNLYFNTPAQEAEAD